MAPRGAPRCPAARAAISRRIGRSRLPPAPAMNSPISCMRPTGEATARAMASSMARISGPTARATRSLRSASSGVGAFTGVGGSPPSGRSAPSGGSPNDDPVLDLDLVAGGDARELDHGELVPDLGHAARGDLLVQLAQELARDGVDDGDLVPAHADLGARPDAILSVEIDHDPSRVHEDHEAAGGRQPGPAA